MEFLLQYAVTCIVLRILRAVFLYEIYSLIGGLEHDFYFSIELGMS